MDLVQALQAIAARYQQIHQNELASERTLVEQYRAQFPILVKQYRKAKGRRPRPLTIPEIFRSSYDENFISDYLAYILDPQRNGIGPAPLEALLNLCDIEYDDTSLAEASILSRIPA